MTSKENRFSVLKIGLHRYHIFASFKINFFACIWIHIGYNVECEKSTPVNYFWYRNTLDITPNIEISGSLKWWMVISVATAWGVMYICFIKGIESMGKVSGPGENI